ncbi:SIS domain-containing protein [Roseibacterium sp. SDUM158017]|uniref:SIS domain-containing protein n=1 Tax=Roseicyclus salinarum TaxID=3036773 RepID=UPI00241536D8|nr:SIS domain-containing protein [Roseibacterium sp. SDUM158017]MDG4649554.1 SIS domain-containing protein [Roseibacterium sp. SDUM158017]
MSPRDFARTALAEIGEVMDRLDVAPVRAACERIVTSRHVMVHGCGREGLMMRALAMRLHHLGLSVSVQGDMAAPPLSRGDVFVVSAGPGELSTVTALMGQAREAGADIIFLTAVPETHAAHLASLVLPIPAQTRATEHEASSALPMGSLYEGAMFVLFEAMIDDLARHLGQSAGDMRARHTNME